MVELQGSLEVMESPCMASVWPAEHVWRDVSVVFIYSVQWELKQKAMNLPNSLSVPLLHATAVTGVLLDTHKAPAFTCLSIPSKAIS